MTLDAHECDNPSAQVTNGLTKFPAFMPLSCLWFKIQILMIINIVCSVVRLGPLECLLAFFETRRAQDSSWVFEPFCRCVVINIPVIMVLTHVSLGKMAGVLKSLGLSCFTLIVETTGDLEEEVRMGIFSVSSHPF